MYIRDIFAGKKPVLSLEVFPPKAESGFDSVKKTVTQISSLKIDYMSVTYGAGGSTSKTTASVSSFLENELNVTALSHLTCVRASRADITERLSELSGSGIKNILALRGDLPKYDGGPVFCDFTHASDLIKFIKENGDFCVGGACYPESHPDSSSREADIEALRIKADSGCDFLVTQMFFDNGAFYNFRDKCVQKGINIPITAGIMPLTNIGQIEKMCVLSGGAAMPAKFTRMISKFSDNPLALKQAGIAYAVDQITDLAADGVDGIHIYTMNKPDVAEKIVNVTTGMFA